MVGLCAAAQADAGAQVVQIFDSWASQLAPQDFEVFSAPYIKQIIADVRKVSNPNLCNTSHLLSCMLPQQCWAVFDAINSTVCMDVIFEWVATLHSCACFHRSVQPLDFQEKRIGLGLGKKTFHQSVPFQKHLIDFCASDGHLLQTHLQQKQVSRV